MLTYRELLKKVHPDLNPQIKDPGVKIAEIMANKDNPSILMNLAIRWGLIEGSKKKSTFNGYSNHQQNSKSDWRFFDYNIRKRVPYGSKVRFKTKAGMKEAYFIFRTKTEIFMTDLIGYFSLKTTFKNLHLKIEFNPYDYISMTEVNKWEKIIKKENNTQTSVYHNSKFGEKISDHYNVFQILNLRQNKHYYTNEKRFVYYQYGWYKIIKTNEKCVFIDFNGEIRKLQLKVIKTSK